VQQPSTQIYLPATTVLRDELRSSNYATVLPRTWQITQYGAIASATVKRFKRESSGWDVLDIDRIEFVNLGRLLIDEPFVNSESLIARPVVESVVEKEVFQLEKNVFANVYSSSL
jgi:hypothetical protein